MPTGQDVFSRRVHGIRLRYAVVGVCFLVLVIGLFHLGGPRAFGWRDFVNIFVLILMVLTLFLLQCHYILSPIERMTAELNALIGRTMEGSGHLRLDWNGRDEFASLAAAINGVLEIVQSRSVGLLEENQRLREIVASADVELVMFNRSGAVLNVIHCPEQMSPVPGLVRGFEPDAAIWGEENRKAFHDGLAAAFREEGTQSFNLSFAVSGGKAMRRLRAFVKRPNGGTFPLVFFRDEPPTEVVGVKQFDYEALTRFAGGLSRGLASGALKLEDLAILGGEATLKVGRLTAGELVASARGAIDALAARSGVSVRYGAMDDATPLVADRVQFTRILTGLVSQAIESFGIVPGVITIEVAHQALSADAGTTFEPPLEPCEGALFSVSDDGPGLDGEIAARFFEPYVFSKSEERGLALTLIRSLVIAQGGGVRVTSSRGFGTTVEIFLPASTRPTEDLDFLLREFPGGEVLVVDDSPSVLRITASLMRTQQIAAHLADCRADAIRKFGELSSRLRAVFLDAQLGDDYSVDLLESMRGIDPKVPVVVVSAYSRHRIDELFGDMPPDAYLMKPYTIKELSDLLATFPRPAQK